MGWPRADIRTGAAAEVVLRGRLIQTFIQFHIKRNSATEIPGLTQRGRQDTLWCKCIKAAQCDCTKHVGGRKEARSGQVYQPV